MPQIAGISVFEIYFIKFMELLVSLLKAEQKTKSEIGKPRNIRTLAQEFS
jgi:hypothetical protein